MTDTEARDLTRRVAGLLGWSEIMDGWQEGPFQPRTLILTGRSPEKDGRRVGVVPDYATDWGAMREVVEWIRANNAVITLLSQFADGKWECDLIHAPECEPFSSRPMCDDLPEAVCRAALALAERLKPATSPPTPPSSSPSSTEPSPESSSGTC